MKDVIFGICEICEEEGILETTQFVFGIDCQCCEGNHFEPVNHCGSCVPIIPEYISYKSKSGVEMIDIESELFIYMHGN